MAHQEGNQSGSQMKQGDDGMYSELWRLCAGPLFNVPCIGDTVFYFPQGHIEVLREIPDQEINQDNPKFNLPPKILCGVVEIRLLDTDEPYACVTLIPEPMKTKQPSECNPICFETPKQKFYSFCKTLSASDTSTHGGFSILRKHATECLPQLDLTQPNASQELVTHDIHGVEWKFKHIYRGHPRRHLLTTGWSAFVASKRLVVGDTFVFLRGENGQMRVGIRRLAPLESPMPSSIVSSQSMCNGVLFTAGYSVKYRTMFVVYYKPRATQFIVGMNKYLEAMNNVIRVGTRFRMIHEGKDSLDRRFFGTIVEIGDQDPEWLYSPWRSLKVQWVEPAKFQRPDRVSFWEIVPFVVPALHITQPVMKRFKHDAEASSSGSKDNQVECSQKQNDIINSNPIDTNSCSPRVGTEGMHHSSPHLNDASPRYFPDPKGKSVAEEQPFRPINELAHDHGKMAENAMEFRLLGVNLTGISSNVTVLEQELFPCGPKESVAAIACETERVQNKQGPLSPSTMRTRTKVKMQGVAVGRVGVGSQHNGPTSTKTKKTKKKKRKKKNPMAC